MSRPISRLTGGALAATGAVLAAASVALVLLFSQSSSAATPTAHTRAVTTSATVISAHRTSVGTILTGPGGETLYAFTRDSRNHDVCASVHGCLSAWPLITTSGKASAGTGVNHSLLGTITVEGKHQVTYAGHPLYSYAADHSAGDTDYVGADQFGGDWPAVSPAGHFVH